MVVYVLMLNNDHELFPSILGVFSNEMDAAKLVAEREQINITLDWFTVRSDMRMTKTLWRGNDMYFITQCTVDNTDAIH